MRTKTDYGPPMSDTPAGPSSKNSGRLLTLYNAIALRCGLDARPAPAHKTVSKARPTKKATRKQSQKSRRRNR